MSISIENSFSEFSTPTKMLIGFTAAGVLLGIFYAAIKTIESYANQELNTHSYSHPQETLQKNNHNLVEHTSTQFRQEDEENVNCVLEERVRDDEALYYRQDLRRSNYDYNIQEDEERINRAWEERLRAEEALYYRQDLRRSNYDYNIQEDEERINRAWGERLRAEEARDLGRNEEEEQARKYVIGAEDIVDHYNRMIG